MHQVLELWLYDHLIVWTLLICPEYEIYVKKGPFFCWNISSFKMQFFPRLLRTMRNRWWSLVMVQDENKDERISAGNGQKKDSNCIFRMALQQCKKGITLRENFEILEKKGFDNDTTRSSSRKFCHKL